MLSTSRTNSGRVSMRVKAAACAMALALLSDPYQAEADPLVKMEGGKATPGVVTAWKGNGKKVELALQEGTDASAVASAIESGVDRVKAKVVAGRVLVVGKTEADLLQALADVEFGDDALGALAAAAMGGDDLDSGSSLRAKKTAELAKIFKDQKTTAMGKVVAVGGEFPEAIVQVKVLKGPTGDLGKKIRKGRTVKFKPVLKMKAGQADLTDGATQTNLGAWYLEKGDRVRVKIGDEKNGLFEAVYISR